MPVRSSKSKSFNLSLLIVLHLLITIPLAYFLNIWADEASTLYTTENGFFAAFQNAAADEKQAPLYFWILSLWRSINGSIFFARLFSVICSVAAIRVFGGLANRLYERRAALLATAFFALHPSLIWASLEIRVYSLVILLSVLLLRLFFDGFWEESHAEPQRKTRVGFLVVAIITLYTNYYLGFLLAGFFAALLVSKRWRASRTYFALMAVAGVAFLPLVLIVGSQFLTNTGGFTEEKYLLEGVRYLWHHVVTFVLPADILSSAEPTAFSIFRVWAVRLVIAALAVLTVMNRKNISGRTIGLGTLTAVIGFSLLAAYFIVGPTYIEVRHASVLFVPLILFVASLISDIFNKKSEPVIKATAFVAGLLILVSFSYSLTNLYPNMIKRGDWARIAEFIERNESPGEPIVVFSAFESLALPYYYRGVNKILPDDGFFTFEPEAEFGTAGSFKKEIGFVTSKIPADAEKIWLAVNEICLTTEACLPLENFVAANYTIEREQDFYLEKLFLLRKKAQ